MGILDELSISRKQAYSIATANADASRSQINLWHGAVRSGKTIGSLVKFEIKLADAPSTGENVLISRTRDTAYRNVIAPPDGPGPVREPRRPRALQPRSPRQRTSSAKPSTSSAPPTCAQRTSSEA